jgi:putative hemolysin
MLTVGMFIALLIALNALYVAAEFGAVSVRRSAIQELADGGNRLAARLAPVLHDPARLDRYIAACQIGITWSSLVLGAYSQSYLTPLVVPLLEAHAGLDATVAVSAATAGVLIVMTTFQVVLGELIPKSLALQYPTKTALYTLPAMKVSLAAYSWFLSFLNGSGLAILRVLGFKHTGHGHIHSPEEIELLIAESRDGGLLEPEEHERLRRALRLVSRPVRQLMVPRNRVAVIHADATPDELAGRLKSSPYTRLPVYEASPDQITGLLHSKDVVSFVIEKGRVPSPREVMRPLASIPETVKADQLITFFRERKTHQACVVDEHGVVGLVTVGDLVYELLGDSAGHFRAGQLAPERLPDGRIRLPGLLRIDEAEPWLGMAIESPADTLAGHVMHVLGRMPAAGEKLRIGPVEIEVDRVDGGSIDSLLVVPAPAQEPSDG